MSGKHSVSTAQINGTGRASREKNMLNEVTFGAVQRCLKEIANIESFSNSATAYQTLSGGQLLNQRSTSKMSRRLLNHSDSFINEK